MKYGHFDDARKEYVIDGPYTPLPWINYLGQNDFLSLISNTGGGYSFYKDARLRRITRYRYNNVPTDIGGRMYYLNDGEDIWSPTFLPVGEDLDSYACRHGLGYTIFEAEKNEIKSELTCFVPLNETAEINVLKLKNTADESKNIRIISAVEWCLWDAEDDAQNFQRNLNTGEVEVEDGVIYHKTEYRERRNHYAYFAVNHEIDGFDTDRNSFIGFNRGWVNPKVVATGESTNSIAHGWSPIASHNINIELEPGESLALVYVLGYAELKPENKWTDLNVINKAPAKELLARYKDISQVEAAFKKLNEHWDKLLSKFEVKSAEDNVDRMVNIWNQYQNMVTFNLSRSASYFESGIGRGMGFRDSCQDLLGFVHLVPERARERIMDIAATQKPDGSAWHQYQPLTKKGNSNIGGNFNDDPLWLIAAVDAYLRETGDASILKEPVQFNNEAGSEEPLLEHLRRSMDYIIKNKGPHGLPLIGRADWNDCLNLNTFSKDPSESFQTTASNIEDDRTAESVMIAEMFILYGKQYLKILEHYGDVAEFDAEEELEHARAEVKAMEDAINEHAWDGKWYLRAYDAFSNKVGTSETEEGKIFIESQAFAGLAEIGLDNGRTKEALESVKELLTTEYGTCLVWPAYSKYHLELGEITSYPQGYKENGAIFCHTNPWLAIAYTKVGDPEEAFNVYRRISPAYTEVNSDIKKTEPYVYCQMLAGKEAPTFGEGKNSWLTGTAAWNFVAITQYILGIFPNYEGLELRPCLPEAIPELEVKRYFRGTIYDISIKPGDSVSLEVDGEKLEGNIIPLSDKDEVKVNYTYKK